MTSQGHAACAVLGEWRPVLQRDVDLHGPPPVLPALPLHPAGSAQGKQGFPSSAGSLSPPGGLCSG